jgi:SAM-dependent methyltransferase
MSVEGVLHNCPVCSGSLSKLMKLKGDRTGKKTPLYFCRECDCFFQRPDYREDDQQLLVDFQWHLDNIDSRLEHSRKIVKRLLAHQPDIKTMLDIGCGIGASIRAAAEAGITCQGVEPNLHAVSFAKERFSLDIVPGYFSPGLFTSKFDAIILDQVLEHLAEPPAFMRDVLSVLKPGGLLYLAVPGRRGGLLRIAYSLLFKPARYSIFMVNDVHINHFSDKSLGVLVESCGGAVIDRVKSGAVIARKLGLDAAS